MYHNDFKRILFLLSVLLTFTLNAETIGGVTYSLPKDGKKWKAGRELQTANNSTLIYNLDNEDAENWTESFAVNVSDRTLGDPKKFEDSFKELMKNFYPNKKVQHRILEADDDQLFVEWWIEGTNGDEMHSWIRLINTPEGVVALQYSTRKGHEVEQARKTWEPALRQAQAAEPATQPQE